MKKKKKLFTMTHDISFNHKIILCRWKSTIPGIFEQLLTDIPNYTTKYQFPCVT